MEGGRVVLELRAQNPGFADARDGNLLPDIKSTTIHSQQSEKYTQKSKYTHTYSKFHRGSSRYTRPKADKN